MFKTFLLIAALLPAAAETAQVLCALRAGGASYNAYSDERPTDDALELAGRVNQALVSSCIPNCPRISLFRNAKAADVMLIAAAGQSKIVYKPEFFTTVYESYGDGGILAIFAHEVGHAISATASAPWMKNGWSPELRADAWAGCALAKMNLTKNALRSSLTTLSKYASPSDPEWKLRLPVLRLGYTQCGGDESKFER